jgi:hypothetical protein
VGYDTTLPHSVRVSDLDKGDHQGHQGDRPWRSVTQKLACYDIHQTVSFASVRRRHSASHSTSLHISWIHQIACLTEGIKCAAYALNQGIVQGYLLPLIAASISGDGFVSSSPGHVL